MAGGGEEEGEEGAGQGQPPGEGGSWHQEGGGLIPLVCFAISYTTVNDNLIGFIAVFLTIKT